MALGWRGQYLRYKEFFLNVLAVYKRRQDLKAFLEILLSLATISILSILALRPTLMTIATLIKENRSKEEAVATMEQKIRNLGLAQAAFREEAARLSLVELAVPNLASPEIFVRQIEALSQAYSVNLLSVSFEKVTLVGPEDQKRSAEELGKLPEGAKDLAFSVTALGNYQNLSTFLFGLENLRRPVKIDSLSIGSGTTAGENLVLVISARVPYLGEGQK